MDFLQICSILEELCEFLNLFCIMESYAAEFEAA